MSGKPIPKPSYLDGCVLLGAINGKKRWRSIDYDRLYEWDSLHWEIEVYNNRGVHLGTMDHTGKLIKLPIKGRRIDV